MNEEQLKRIDDLRAEIDKQVETNAYGLVKIKNVICSRLDLEHLYFITGLLKGGYSASTISEDILTDAVKKVLSKTKIDLSLGDEYIEKKLKEKEEQILERTKARTKINKSLDALIKRDTLDTILDAYNLKDKYNEHKQIKELLNKDEAIEDIRDAFKEFFSRAEEEPLEERKRIISDFFSYARDFIKDEIKLNMLEQLETEIIEEYIGKYLDKVNKELKKGNKTMKKEDLIKEFNAYLEEHAEEEKEQIVNDFFSNVFYDIENEEDLNEVNEAEATIRQELGLEA